MGTGRRPATERYGQLVKRDGYWHADFLDAKGRRVRFALRLPDSVPVAHASARLHEMLELRKSRPADARIDRAFEKVIAVKEQTRDPQTAVKYKRILERFRGFLEARRVRYLAEIEPEHLCDYAAERRAIGRAEAGIRSDLTHIQAALNLLRSWGQMPEGFDSTSFFREAMPRDISKRERVFSDLELRVLFADPKFGDVFEALYLLGCRIGVLLQLHKNHIGDKLIRLPRGKQGKLHDIPLSSQFRAFLGRHTPASSRGYLFWRDKWGEPGSVASRGVAQRAILRRLNTVLKANGFKPARIHDFRATCATRLVAAGLNLFDLIDYIGWSAKSLPMIKQKYYRRKPEDIVVPDLTGVSPSRIRQVRNDNAGNG